jgi:hypothetical protein
MANNRELSQFGNFISVNDTSENIGISTDVIISGVLTATRYYGDGSQLTGIATVGGGTTLGITTITDLTVTGVTSLTSLVVSGVSTFGNIVLDPVGIITAASGIVTYYGDGSNLTGVISGVGISTEGGSVGTGATVLDFRGAGISTVTVGSGIGTIFIQGGGGGGAVSISSIAPTSPSNGDLWYSIIYGRTFVYYDEVALGVGATAVWVDAAPFNVGVITAIYGGVAFSDGTASTPSWYFTDDTTTGVFSPVDGELTFVSTGSSILNVNSSGIIVTGVSTLSTALVSDLNVTGVSTLGTLQISSGIVTATSGIVTYYGDGQYLEGIAAGGSGQFNTGITSSLGYAVTDSMATAYTASDAVVVHSIHVTNIDGEASADISGQLYSGQYSIAHTVPVPAGSSVELLKQPKILNTGETIQLQANTSGDLHATITVEEKTGDTTYIGVGVDITSAATYTDLWTATANSVLQGILLANDDGTADVKARVVWTDGSNNIQGYYAYDLTIPADATVEILEQPKYLPSGYKVRVYANQADRLEAILSARTIA